MPRKRAKDPTESKGSGLSGTTNDTFDRFGGQATGTVRKQLNLDESLAVDTMNDSGISSLESSPVQTSFSKKNGSYLDYNLVPRFGGLFISTEDNSSDKDSGVSSEHDSVGFREVPELKPEEFSDTEGGYQNDSDSVQLLAAAKRSGVSGVDIPAILCLLVLLVVLILSFVVPSTSPVVHYEQTDDELHLFLGQHFFLKIFGLLSAMLVALLVGISCCWFSWAVTLQDSAAPQQLPASPISPAPLRVKSGHSFHLAYMMSLLNGLAMFCYATWWQRHKYLP